MASSPKRRPRIVPEDEENIPVRINESRPEERTRQPPRNDEPTSDRTLRNRGGFHQAQLNTVPSNITEVRSTDSEGTKITVLSNFIKVEPMPDRAIFQYRIDFEPNLESMEMRKQLFHKYCVPMFKERVIYDNVSDARSIDKLAQQVTEIWHMNLTNDDRVKIIVTNVGVVVDQFELIRVYNMHMKGYLRALGYYLVSNGAYVHPSLSTPIGTNGQIRAVRGYKTAANVYDHDAILMNLEACHKLTQTQNVLQYMVQIRSDNRQNFIQAIKNNMQGKLVVTNYNKVIYKVEEVDFEKNPLLTFYDDKRKTEVTYKDYYESRYNMRVSDLKQPLLLAVNSNKRKRSLDLKGEEKDIYLVPEFCNITGLTDEQRADNRLRIDLVRASQISPSDRVDHLKIFLKQLHESGHVLESLKQWGYMYSKEPVSVPGRQLPTEKIGIGRWAEKKNVEWPKVNARDAGFDELVMREQCAVVPPLPNLKIIIGPRDFQAQATVLKKIKSGFDKVGLKTGRPEIIRLEGNDTAHSFASSITRLPNDTTAAIVILPNQNKERYDAIKKAATVERGMITQVVTSRLLTDERKANGASVKIGIQVVAKLGGEPWHINLPMPNAMVCGYDTYHDTTKRGRSYGAFIASMNSKYSQWFSKADKHDNDDELSSHMTENLKQAIEKYKEINGTYPDRLIFYRDGVSDGQLNHVVRIELKQITSAVKIFDKSIRLAVIVVNKRVGARFYWKNGASYLNCIPGTVIDDVVTRKERYDFYLVSQSTRQGTITPTYYNIIHDETGLDPSKHQKLAYKMCFAYYNWTGTVRVPAPCQYAHKLALLCGEHLHSTPNEVLHDRLHFL